MNPSNLIINMHQICKSYGTEEAEVRVLKNIDFKVRNGEFVAILGPSGSGKSTLMNIIGLIDTSDSGRYILSGEDIAQSTENEYADIRNKRIGFVFQRFNLISKYSARYNVALPLIVRGYRAKDAAMRAEKLLSAMGLGDRINYRPNQLSGGQQQRVAIARALVSNPDVILADEPTGSLDSVTGRDILSIFKELNRKGKTIILITHDLGIAKQAERIVHIIDGNILSDSDVKSAVV